MIFLHPSLLKKNQKKMLYDSWRKNLEGNSNTSYDFVFSSPPFLGCGEQLPIVKNSYSLSSLFHVKRKVSYPSSFLSLGRCKHSFPLVGAFTHFSSVNLGIQRPEQNLQWFSLSPPLSNFILPATHLSLSAHQPPLAAFSRAREPELLMQRVEMAFVLWYLISGLIPMSHKNVS